MDAPDILTVECRARLAATDQSTKVLKKEIRDYSHGTEASKDNQGITHPDVNKPPIMFSNMTAQNFNIFSPNCAKKMMSGHKKIRCSHIALE